jgi:subtilisin family serine protease
MKKSQWLAITIFTGMLAVSGWLASAQAQRKFEAQEKIAPWLQTQLAETTQQELEFLVILKDQADLCDAELYADKRGKSAFVRATLWAKAQTTQAPLITWLKERNASYRSFYIMNALWVKGSRALASEIAARPEVARVEGNPQLNFTAPVESFLDNAARLQAQPTIEPGITYIRANELWKEGFTGQGVVVGGQDTGVDWTHTTLQARYRGKADEQDKRHDYNWHDSIHTGGSACGADAPAPCDDNNHGTHTLGTVVGADDINQIGVAPSAQFIACRNMDRGVGSPATYLECFEFMLAPYPVKGMPEQGDPTKAPDLTVNSWRCPPSEGCSLDTLRFAIEAQRAAGILTIVSAGNEGPGCATILFPPAYYSAAYAVGAFDANNNGLIASFSGRGPVATDNGTRVKPDITAPGVFVRSALRNNTFGFLSGTSMAAPHVAGAVALLWSARPELKNQIALTESLLNEAAVRVESTECGATGIPNFVYGFGRLDVKTAYDLAAASVELSADTIIQAGGALSVEVAASAALKWRAVSYATWLTINGDGERTGSGNFEIRVTANPNDEPRTGTVVIAGRPFAIVQAGSLPYAVAGRVAENDGDGMRRVPLVFTRLDGDGNVPEAVQTDDSGRWSQSGFLPGVTYRVTATRFRQTFEPRSYVFSAPLSAINFKAVNRRITVATAR